MITSLNEERLQGVVSLLCQKDPLLDSIVQKYGAPPLWAREPGFPTLIHIILEQQVSLASAKACFDKLKRTLSSVSPQSILTLSDEALLSIGFSRQKTRYSRILAKAVLEGSLDLDTMNEAADKIVFSQLTQVTGIGPWTANIYLLMALGRPDIWPVGDLALELALRDLHRLDHRPGPADCTDMAASWRPHRAVAARILWHYYLSR